MRYYCLSLADLGLKVGATPLLSSPLSLLFALTFPFSPARRSEKRCKLPNPGGVPGRSPITNAFVTILTPGNTSGDRNFSSFFVAAGAHDYLVEEYKDNKNIIY